MASYRDQRNILFYVQSKKEKLKTYKFGLILYFTH